MARIAGVDIQNDKREVISADLCLWYRTCNISKILAAAGVSEDIRVRDLHQIKNAIRREVDAIKVEAWPSSWSELDQTFDGNRFHRGIRHRRGLPSVDKTLKTTLAP